MEWVTWIATNFTLDASGKSISLGTGDTIFIADADEGIQLGDATFADAPFSVTTAGVLKAESGTIGGWNIDSSKIYSTNLPISIGSAIFLVGSVFSIFLIFLLPTSSKVLGVKKDPGAILIMEIFFFKK